MKCGDNNNCVVNLSRYYNIVGKVRERYSRVLRRVFFFSLIFGNFGPCNLRFRFFIFFLSIEIESQVIFGVVVAVICFVVHNKIAIDKIKRIRFRFKRISNHLLDCLRLQFGKVIDMFHSVFAVGYTKSKIKIERFEHFVAEKVSFNHTEILDGLGTNAEINGSANFLKPRIENKSLIHQFITHIKLCPKIDFSVNL